MKEIDNVEAKALAEGEQRAAGDRASSPENEDVFGKAPGPNDSANLGAGRIDERTSLLPDGQPRADNVEGNNSKDDGGNGSGGEQ